MRLGSVLRVGRRVLWSLDSRLCEVRWQFRPDGRQNVRGTCSIHLKPLVTTDIFQVPLCFVNPVHNIIGLTQCRVRHTCQKPTAVRPPGRCAGSYLGLTPVSDHAGSLKVAQASCHRIGCGRRRWRQGRLGRGHRLGGRAHRANRAVVSRMQVVRKPEARCRRTSFVAPPGIMLVRDGIGQGRVQRLNGGHMRVLCDPSSCGR